MFYIQSFVIFTYSCDAIENNNIDAFSVTIYYNMSYSNAFIFFIFFAPNPEIYPLRILIVNWHAEVQPSQILLITQLVIGGRAVLGLGVRISIVIIVSNKNWEFFIISSIHRYMLILRL